VTDDSGAPFGPSLEDLDAVVWEADARTSTFLSVEGAVERVTGWTAAEWLARPGFFATQLHPDDRERVLASLLAAGIGASLSIEHRLLAPDGATKWLHTTGHLADGPGGPGTIVRGVSVDVTASRGIDATQQEAESRFRRVVERLPAIVYLEAIDGADGEPGSLLYVSPQVQNILGFSAQEWVEQPTSWERRFHPDDRERVREIYRQVADGGSMFAADYRMFTRDGRIRWFHDEALMIRDERGEPLFWQGIMIDITAQREQQELTRETETRYRTLVEQLPAIVYSEDVTGDGLQMVYINAQVRHLLGVEPEEWVANPSVWSDAIHPDDVDAVMALNAQTEITGEPFSTEYRMIARDGHIVWFKDEARLVRREDGEPAFWQGVMIDITGRKQAEAQLAETEARYRTLVEQTPSITYIASLGLGTGVLYVSPQTEEILGYTPQDWYADPQLWSKIVHPDDQGRNHPDPSVGEHSQRYRLVARDGREVWVHDQARVIADEAGEPRFWQGVMVDVTQQRRAEALERDLATERLTSEQLREADTMKSTFLQAVSHDLRSPLAAILGLARTLERDDLNLPPDQARDLAGRIVSNARRLDRIVADLLDLERLEAGVVEPIFAPVDVGSLVRELTANADVVAGRRLQLDTAPLVIAADAMMVERIVENLLGNAAKHTPGDSRIWVRVERTDDGALITVDDDGPGVSADQRERIFEAFTQGEPAGAGHGAGVGLALVARFAALHGGEAWAQERPGGGASFRVRLAAAPAEPEPAEPQPGESQPGATDPASEASQA
jgi:PAS domain S-box-containing protein